MRILIMASLGAKIEPNPQWIEKLILEIAAQIGANG